MIAQIDNLYLRQRPFKVLQRLVSYIFFEGRPLTTRGRWINYYILAAHRIIKILPMFKEVEKPIFIIGTGRSGTTLLGILLSMHKDVGYLNEPKALWHSVYPHEDIIGNYSTVEGKYRLRQEDANLEVTQAAHKLFGAYTRVVCVQRVVDKYPEIVFRVPFVKSIFPDAKFIFLTRNGYDTVASIKKWSKSKRKKTDIEISDWWGKNGRKWKILIKQIAIEDPDLGPIVDKLLPIEDDGYRAIVEWILSMREGLAVLKQFPQNVFLLRYEELAIDPAAKLTELLYFCELQDDPIFMDYSIKKIHTSSEHIRIKIPEFLRSEFHDVMKILEYE